MWCNLREDIVSEFQNPTWLQIAIHAHDLSVLAESDLRTVLSRKRDEDFARLVVELGSEQNLVSARDLAAAAGYDTAGAALVCANVLREAGWTPVRARGAHQVALWLNTKRVLSWCAARGQVRLTEAAKAFDVQPKTLGPLLRQHGWRETRDAARRRVWCSHGVE